MPWPADVPILTADEAKRAARKLWRFAMGETWKGTVVVTSGRRHTWERNGTLYVNPTHGWCVFVNDLAWLFFTRANPGMLRNTKDIAKLEEKLIREVVKRGWLYDQLKTEEEPELIRLVREHQTTTKRLDAAVKRWERKLALAKTMLAKAKKARRAHT